MTALETALTLIATLVADLSNSSKISSVISALEQIVATAINEITTIAPEIKNIINALKANATVTPDDMNRLLALDATTDAAFEAAAKDAGV